MGKVIKCPNCGAEFDIDESSYNSIVKQVRDEEFEKDVEMAKQSYRAENKAALQLAESRKDSEISKLKAKLESMEIKMKSEVQLAEEKAKSESKESAHQMEKEIAELRAKLDSAESEKKLALANAEVCSSEKRMELDRQITDLKRQIQTGKAEAELSIQTVRTQYEQKLKEKRGRGRLL